MKRIISCLLAVLLLVLTSFQTSVVVFAKVSPKFTVATERADPGQKVSVAIRIDNNPGVASVKLKVQFDNALLLDSITYNAALGGRSQQPETFTSPVTLNWFNGDANTTGDMTYAVLNFTVAEDASVAFHPVTVTYNKNDVYNIDEDNIPFKIVNGGVNVTVSVSGLALDPAAATVSTGDKTVTLSPVFTPANATNQKVSWHSSDESVATVDGGTVTLLKKGSAVITAVSEDGGFEATCTLTVLCSHLQKHDVPAEASTCIKHGHGAYTICDECGEVISGSADPLPFAEHQYVENVQPQYLKSAANCMNPAVYYKSCSVCGEKGTDTFEYGEKDPDHHVGGTHIVNQKDVSCTEDGYTGDVVCDSCGETITPGSVIGKLGHLPADPVKENEVQPQVGIPGGYDEVVYCSRCSEELSRVHKTVSMILIGDVNGDGVVSNRDAVILDRYVANWLGYDQWIYNMDCADLSRDSDVNNRDAVMLDRYIAGWSGYDKFIIPVLTVS